MAEPCRRCGGTGLEIDHRATGAHCRGIRLDEGLTLREKARQMGISAAYLSDLERGNRAWNPKLLAAYGGVSDA